MKYIFTICLFFLFSASVYAERKGDSRTLGYNDMKGEYELRTICVDGYKFVLAITYKKSATITQMFINAGGKSLPDRC